MLARSTQGTIAVACLLLSAVLLIGVRQPLLDRLEAAQTTKATLEQDIANAQQELTQLEQAVATVADIEETQRAGLADSIPAQYLQDELLEDMVGLARRNAVTIAAMAFTKEGVADMEGLLLDTLTVTMTAPSQRQFIRFLEALERDPRVYRIRQMTNDYQSTTIDTTLVIETYHGLTSPTQ